MLKSLVKFQLQILHHISKKILKSFAALKCTFSIQLPFQYCSPAEIHGKILAAQLSPMSTFGYYGNKHSCRNPRTI